MAAENVTVRPARPGDAARIAEIYNQGIEDRVATLETTLRSAEERTSWLAAHDDRHPVLVATDPADRVVGWASLNPFNARAAYRQVADLSVYVARESRGRGIGRMLVASLEVRARDAGFHKLVLAALTTNIAGTRLYVRCGFRHVGTYREQGLLDGAWVDVSIMEKIL
jgi:phosphinothricin acetyltransferase